MNLNVMNKNAHLKRQIVLLVKRSNENGLKKTNNINTTENNLIKLNLYEKI